MPETYKITLQCNNCNNTNEVEIEKGDPISEGICPNCGCKGLVKPFEEPYIA